MLPVRIAGAQTYPARPVHLIVPSPAGGGNDIFARLMGQWLSQRFGQPIVIENRPGASTNIGTEAVVRAPPDGYTLLLVGPPAAINATLYDKLNFNFIRDIAPIAAIARIPYVMVVEPSFPAKTLAEFIAYAKANSGKLSMAAPGSGTGPQMAGELFKLAAGVDLVAVYYRGDGPALTDLMARQVQVYFSALPAAVGFVKAGKLRALAVTGATRSDALPDIPSVAEFLPGYEASGLYGVGAPKSTPVEIVSKLNSEINAGLADPKIKQLLADMGAIPAPVTPAGFGKLIADETEKWGKVIRAANIKPD